MKPHIAKPGNPKPGNPKPASGDRLALGLVGLGLLGLFAACSGADEPGLSLMGDDPSRPDGGRQPPPLDPVGDEDAGGGEGGSHRAPVLAPGHYVFVDHPSRPTFSVTEAGWCWFAMRRPPDGRPVVDTALHPASLGLPELGRCAWDPPAGNFLYTPVGSLYHYDGGGQWCFFLHRPAANGLPIEPTSVVPDELAELISSGGGRCPWDAPGAPPPSTEAGAEPHPKWNFDPLADRSALVDGGAQPLLVDPLGDADNGALHGTAASEWIEAGGGDDVVLGLDGGDALLGGPGEDRLIGNRGHDRLLGGPGDDQLHGGRGDDALQGNTGADTLFGDDGDDVVRGGRGADFVQGNAGADRLYGDYGDDVVHGGRGHDVLLGGPGDDRLHGDVGDDRYIIRRGDGRDVIQDFGGGVDALVCLGFSAGEVSRRREGLDEVFVLAGGGEVRVVDHYTERGRLERLDCP